MHVAQIANTFVGKPGNIGVRTARVLRALDVARHRPVCLSRGAVERRTGVDYVDMGWLGHVPRALNAVRIYVTHRFDHRPADIALFERFVERRLPGRGILEAAGGAVAHVWEYAPRLLSRLREAGVRVVLDVPIAPATYARRMRDSGRAPFFVVHDRHVDFELESFALADVVVAPSAFVADELRAAGVDPRRIVTIEFGADLPARGGADEPVRDARAGIDFCFVGTVNRRKGIQDLLSAWSDRRFSHDRLHLCGRVFPDVGDALSGARPGTVITPGFVRPAEYLPRCDVFVFPTWLEGSAKAVFEAMALGLPCIVTSSAGSVVRDGIDGFVIEPGDVHALTERMLWFKDDPSRIEVMGRAAQARVRDFTWSRYAERVRALYDGPGGAT
jgi:glycosyltransferase involved in cell wall biosynthesis